MDEKNKIINSESFLQSHEWEEFQKSLGRETFRIMGKLVTKMPLTLGQSYFYCPRAYCKYDQIFDFLKEIKKVAKKEGAFFSRFEPVFIDEKLNINELDLKKVTSRQPKQTLMIDLLQTEEEILANMKSKTRYNIRLAQKKGVKIEQSEDVKDIDIFYKLALETSKRDGIKIYDINYYKKMAQAFSKYKKFKIHLAKYKGEVIASNLMIYYGDIAYYLHGASGNSMRNLMAPYILQWEAIKDAKKNGFKMYDFWGIAPLREITNSKSQIINKSQIQNSNNLNKNQDSKFEICDPKHPWQGITRFKLGFAPNTKTGIYVEYPGCFEISYGKKRYLLYSMFKKAF